MGNILNIKFNAVMTYDDWSIFKYKDKFYIATEEDIEEVVLVKQIKASSSEDIDDDLDYGCDYFGQSDDFEYYLGFNTLNYKEKYERMKVLAYNAADLGLLHDLYTKEEIKNQLGCSDEEYKEIMEV